MLYLKLKIDKISLFREEAVVPGRTKAVLIFDRFALVVRMSGVGWGALFVLLFFGGWLGLVVLGCWLCCSGGCFGLLLALALLLAL